MTTPDRCDPVKIIQLLMTPDNSTWQSTLLGLSNTGEMYEWTGSRWVKFGPSIYEQLESVERSPK